MTQGGSLVVGQHVIVAVPTGGGQNNFAQADANGYYLLENLPAGTITRRTFAQGYSRKSGQVELTNGQRAYKDIQLY